MYFAYTDTFIRYNCPRVIEVITKNMGKWITWTHWEQIKQPQQNKAQNVVCIYYWVHCPSNWCYTIKMIQSTVIRRRFALSCIATCRTYRGLVWILRGGFCQCLQICLRIMSLITGIEATMASIQFQFLGFRSDFLCLGIFSIDEYFEDWFVKIQVQNENKGKE